MTGQCFSVDLDPAKTRHENRKNHGLLVRVGIKNDKGKSIELENTFPRQDKQIKIRTELACNLLYINKYMARSVLDEKSEEKFEYRLENVREFMQLWFSELISLEEDEKNLKNMVLSCSTDSKNQKGSKIGSFLMARGQLTLCHNRQVKERKELMNQILIQTNNNKYGLNVQITLNRADTATDIAKIKKVANNHINKLNTDIENPRTISSTEEQVPLSQRKFGSIGNSEPDQPADDFKIVSDYLQSDTFVKKLEVKYVKDDLEEKIAALKFLESRMLTNISIFMSMPLSTVINQDANIGQKESSNKHKRKKQKYNNKFMLNEFFVYLVNYLNFEAHQILYTCTSTSHCEKTNEFHQNRALRYFQKALSIVSSIDERFSSDICRIKMKSFLGIARILEERKEYGKVIQVRWECCKLIQIEYSMRLNSSFSKKAKKQKYKFHSCGRYQIFNVLCMANCYFKLNLLDRVMECLNVAHYFQTIHFHERSQVITDMDSMLINFKNCHLEMMYEKNEFERVLFDVFHDGTMQIMEMYRVKKIELGIETDWVEQLVYADSLWAKSKKNCDPKENEGNSKDPTQSKLEGRSDETKSETNQNDIKSSSNRKGDVVDEFSKNESQKKTSINPFKNKPLQIDSVKSNMDLSAKVEKTETLKTLENSDFKPISGFGELKRTTTLNNDFCFEGSEQSKEKTVFSENLLRKFASVDHKALVCTKEHDDSNLDVLIEDLYKDEISESFVNKKVQKYSLVPKNPYIQSRKVYGKFDGNNLQADISMHNAFDKCMSASGKYKRTEPDTADYRSSAQNLTEMMSPIFTQRNSMKSYTSNNQKNLTSDARVKTNASAISTARPKYSDEKLTNHQKYRNKFKLSMDPRNLLKFKKKIEFDTEYDPKIMTENYYWSDEKKQQEDDEPVIQELNKKHGNKFMLTRVDKIKGLKLGKYCV